MAVLALGAAAAAAVLALLVVPGALGSPRCPECGGAVAVIKDEMVAAWPAVFEVWSRCAGCGLVALTRRVVDFC